MAVALFWISVAVILYVYVGYPLLLTALRAARHRRVRRRPWEPRVTVVIAAHNEADHIVAKLDNCLSLDYPADRLRVVVSLDGPTDGTDEAVAGYAFHPRVILCGSRRRRGKAAALNRALRHLDGEIVVFTDARQRLDSRAVRRLVAVLADPDVGAVSGELLLLGRDGDESSDGVGLYWRYEKRLRRMESDLHSMLGATGALYAVRRELVAPIPEETILDDMLIPLRAVLTGRRAVFEPHARAYDRVAPPTREYARKVRTLTGNYQLLALMPGLLSPRRNPVFFQLMSHKVGRLLVPYFLAVLYVSSAVLHEGIYAVALVAQTAFYALALAGPLLARVLHRQQETVPTGAMEHRPT